ncbi:Bro-N domain-containing protein [Kitasatospora sp. NPDC048365]|uniref:BRO-N domain-containing protein n=1 Tax=Kitasatospora sp. NPDC048365 TaxID=3364050 RepID=UPI003722B3E3
MKNEADMVLVHSSFPVTGHPIRVVMIDGDPWFATADVCRILEHTNPSKAVRGIGAEHQRTVNTLGISLTEGSGNTVPAGQQTRGRGTPILGVISEAGLYTLLMRSNKPTARPFQEWVTAELLPSIRRGDADVPWHRQRMAETLAEAVGQRVEVLAEFDHDTAFAISVRSDGTVHCRHGEMEFVVPAPEEDSGPPYGGYFRCPSVERVGIRGGRALPRCAKLKLVDLTTHLAHARLQEPRRRPDGGPLLFEYGRARIHGEAPDIAALLREMGEL